MGLVLDQLGGIHLEGLCQIPDSCHARVSYLSPLQAADVVPV